MALHEPEIAIPAQLPRRWEALPVPDDYRIEAVPSADDEPGLFTLLAAWGGETKLTAELDVYQAEAGISRIRRPGHWGEDTRPVESQTAEYMLGLDGMLRQTRDMGVRLIDIGEHSGIAALAIIDLKEPSGWARSDHLEKYNGWFKSPLLDLRQAVLDGAVMSFRYEADPSQHSGVGQIATAGAMLEASSTKIAL